MPALRYLHADVFSSTPYSGNSVPVFFDCDALTSEQMQRITQELRHFEAVFLAATGTDSSAAVPVAARIFDLFEELPFAGHPLLGAAAALHARESDGGGDRTWRFQLASRTVTVTTHRTAGGYYGLLDQGAPAFLGAVDDAERFARAFSLDPGDLRPDLPLEVVSTGLRYLIVPVREGALAQARIHTDVTNLLRGVNAQYAVLLDETALELRHWNNDGVVEDIATGSAAGTVGAYRLRHALARGGDTFVLRQGRFTGRPSTLHVRPDGTPDDVVAVAVGGDVTVVGWGELAVLP